MQGPDWLAAAWTVAAPALAVVLAWLGLKGQERLRQPPAGPGYRPPSAYRSLAAALCGQDDTPEFAPLRPQQVATAIRGLGFALGTSVVNAAITVAVIGPETGRWPVALWVLAVGSFLAFGLAGWLRTRGRPTPASVSAGTVRKLALQAALHGAIWGCGFVLFYAEADGTGRALLLALMLGVAAGGIATLGSIPAAALGFAGAILLPTVAGLAAMGPDHAGLTALFACFFGVMGMTAAQAFESFAGNVAGQLRYKEAADTVALLLNTYEQQASDWLWRADRAGRLLNPPERMLGLLGQPRAAVHGRRWHDLRPAAGEPHGWSRLAAHLEALESFRDVVLAVEAPAGLRWLALSGRFSAEDGTWHGVGSDVTAREAATRALKSAVAAAEAASAAKSAFLATMSHELRTPLNAIIGFSEMMASADLPAEKQREYSQDINGAGRHLLGLVNDILDLTRLEAGARLLEVDAVDVAELVEQCCHLVQPLAQQAGVTLRWRPPEAALVIEGDGRALRQIVLNLLGNAIKFTPGGGAVEVETAARDGRVEVRVADSGIGIPQEKLEQVMQPFVQLEGPFTRRYEGTGLGLPIARRLAELHGGSLALASRPGEGTVARLTLPPAPAAAAG